MILPAPASCQTQDAPTASARAPQVTPPATPAHILPDAPLTLAAATAAALSANPGATAAQQQLVQAQARLAQALAQQRLQISLSSSAGVSNANVIQPPPSQETFYSVINTLTIPLPVGRKPRLIVAQANAQLAAAQAQFRSTRLALATQVASAYYDLLRKQALLKIAQETLATALRLQDETQKRFRAGDVPQLEVDRTQIPVANAQSGVDAAGVAVTVARQALNGALGRGIDEPTAVSEVAPESLIPATALPLTLDAARRQVREQNPDVLAAEEAVIAAEDAQRIAGLSREPLYSLQAGDTRSNDQTAFSRLDNVQATVIIPLGDGGLARGQKREAESVLAQARAQAEAARRNAEVTVSADYLNVQSSLRQIDTARRVQEIAQSTYDKTLLGYQQGLFPLTDALTAQSTLTQERIAYIQALYDAAVAFAILQNALGNLPL